MSKRVSEEVRIMDAFRALPEPKREVVLNLVNAEFRASKKSAAKPSMLCALSVAANWSARPCGLAAEATPVTPATAPAPIMLRTNLRSIIRVLHSAGSP